MAVDVAAGEVLSFGRPRVLFETDFHTGGYETSYDVSADGQRFVMIDVVDTSRPPTELILVENWAEELKRLVPAN